MSADEKAVDVALEITKQIIAISTAVLALTGAFLEKLSGLTGAQRWLLAATWIGFFLAVLLGLAAFMISAGALAGSTGFAVVKRSDLRVVSALEVIVFLIAVLLMLVFAFSRLSSAAEHRVGERAANLTMAGRAGEHRCDQVERRPEPPCHRFRGTLLAQYEAESGVFGR